MARGMGSWKVLKESLELTSLKGIPRIFRSQYVVLKILWALSVLILFGVVVVEVNQSVVVYLGYATVIDNEELLPTEDITAQSNHFPVATFCNLKNLHPPKDALYINPKKYMEESLANISKWKEENQLQSTDNYGNHRRALDYLETMKSYYEFIGVENALDAGSQLEDFLMSCFVARDGGGYSQCSDTGNFVVESTPDYFNCFSFRVHTEFLAKYQPYRISFLLYLDTGDDFIADHYDEEATDLQSIGVKLSLHSHGVPFDFERSALLLSPGHLTRINVVLTERIRLSQPYGDCVQNDNIFYYDANGTATPYSTTACYSACVQDAITQSCACRDPMQERMRTLEEVSLPFCSRPQETFDERVALTMCAKNTSDGASTRCHKQCQAACHQLFVEPSLSIAKWPRKSHQLALYKDLIKSSKHSHKFIEYDAILQEYEETGNITEVFRKLDRLKKMEMNFVRVDLIRSDPGLTRVQDQVKTTFADLLSTIGSLMNLYSGITLIIAVEVVDFFIRIIVYWCTPLKEDKGKEMKEQVAKKVSTTSSDPVMSFVI